MDIKVRDGRVADFAVDVKACALGQASSSLMARHVIGASAKELLDLRDMMTKMLKANGPPPAGKWADFAVLEPVRDFKARHASTLLTFDAVADALGKLGLGRSAADAVASAMTFLAPRRAAHGLIRFYQLTLSSLLGRQCRYLPTCSEYMDEAVQRHGLWAGAWMGTARGLPLPSVGRGGLRSAAPRTLPRGAGPARPWRYGKWRYRCE